MACNLNEIYIYNDVPVRSGMHVLGQLLILRQVRFGRSDARSVRSFQGLGDPLDFDLHL